MRTLRRRHVLLATGVVLAAAVIVGGTVVFRSSGEQTAQTVDPVPPSAEPASPPPPPTTAHHAVVRGGRLLVDAKPFFPIFSWGECTDGFETSLPVGTNLYAGNRCGGLEAQLPALGDRALSAAVQGEVRPAGGSVVGVFYPDEPDGQGLTARTMPTIDPAHGVRFLTLTNHFYSGAAPLPQGRGMYPGLIAKADMIGFDLYPLTYWCRPERLADVYFSQRELVELAEGKPTFQWIEAAGMICPHDGPNAVTPATVRAESWLAIAGGAKGLGFFPPAAWTGDVGEAIADVTAAARDLSPVLLAREAPVRVEPADALVKAGARRFRGGVYIIAVNAGYTPARARVTVPGLGGRALEVYGDGRRVEVDGDSFVDWFPALAARVYVTRS